MGAQLGGGIIGDINMTPLIDIVLVVLIIMMVNIPIQVESMGVKLPAKVENPKDPPPPSEQLVVAMYEDGTMALNKRLIEEEDLFAEVTRRLRPMTKKVVFIDAHPEILYGIVIDMVDLAKEAGAEKVSFAKLKEAGPAAATGLYSGALPKGVYPGSPGVVGAITEKAADAQFAPMLPVVKQCFYARLLENPGMSGRVIFRVDVGPQGEIMDAGFVSGTIEDSVLNDCVVEQIKAGLRYEPLGEQKTARIHYPLLLSSG